MSTGDGDDASRRFHLRHESEQLWFAKSSRGLRAADYRSAAPVLARSAMNRGPSGAWSSDLDPILSVSVCFLRMMCGPLARGLSACGGRRRTAMSANPTQRRTLKNGGLRIRKFVILLRRRRVAPAATHRPRSHIELRRTLAALRTSRGPWDALPKGGLGSEGLRLGDSLRDRAKTWREWLRLRPFMAPDLQVRRLLGSSRFQRQVAPRPSGRPRVPQAQPKHNSGVIRRAEGSGTRRATVASRGRWTGRGWHSDELATSTFVTGCVTDAHRVW